MKRILYVEDDLSLIDGLQYTLEKNDFVVDNARTIKEAYTFFHANTYDLILLDITLPDGTGYDMGGDDYITKPFKLGEVLSRINALLRRSRQFSREDTILESNGITVDLSERTVRKGETELELTLAEYKLLCLFLRNPNRVLSRELILDRLWDGNGNYVDDNTLSVYIRRLRRKIEDNPDLPVKLLTERGVGYKWMKG